jgi:phage head maturation protease
MSTITLESRAPVDNLVRARYDAEASTLRSDADGTPGRTLFGHFAVFDTWTKISSHREGVFMERLGGEAFDETIVKDRARLRILYDHGGDPSIGNKPLGAPDLLQVDRGVGPYYESELFEALYVNELLPALRARQMGASFRFGVEDDEWVTPTRATEGNPDRLQERTIRKVRLYEFGPVTFPAYVDATAGVRSGTDQFYDRLLTDPLFMARFVSRVGGHVAEQTLASVPTIGRSDTTNDREVEPEEEVEPADGGSEDPEATADGQTEGNRNQIAEALKRFRQHT